MMIDSAITATNNAAGAMQDLNLKQAILDSIRIQPDIRLAILFGSLATGEAHEGSDLDIAVDAGHRLTVNEKLVYDIRAYGGPASQGEFAILRRVADNKTDTVVKEKRNGIIADAFLNDGKIFVVLQNPSDSSIKKIFTYHSSSSN